MAFLILRVLVSLYSRVLVEQVVSSDALLIPSGPITRERTKRFKEALNGLIKDIWVKQMG